MRTASWLDDPCPIARTMSVLGQRWAVLIIREALLGRTRYFGEGRRFSMIAPRMAGLSCCHSPALLLTGNGYRRRDGSTVPAPRVALVAPTD